MAVAKITLNGVTLMDTTDATADASKILNTYTAYIGDGSKATGTATSGHVTQDQDGYIVLPKTGGGGGSSDFSTATLTTVDASDIELPIYGAFIRTSYNEDFTNGMVNTVAYEDGEPLYGGVYTIVLYKGKALIWLAEDNTVNYEVSGNIEWDEESGGYLVTGDCTVTVTPY